MAPSVLPGANDHEKLQALAQLTYKEQAVWFLNAFWDTLEKEGETLWNYVIVNAELDLENHNEGCGLDEMKAHVFLEKFNETLTVREMRAKLRSTGALEESERPKIVPLTHFLLYKYGVDWHALVNASQGDNAKEIAKAQAMLEEVQAAFRESDAKHKQAAASFRAAEQAAKEAADREADAKAREAEAIDKEAEAVKQEAPFKAAQEEVEAALAEVKSQEDAYNSRTADLKQKSETGGVVSRNKAANELAQHLAEDPLPLRKAKITLEAAQKRAEKTRAPFEAATKEAQAARAVAEEAAGKASNARKAADAAKDESERDKRAAEAAVEQAKQRVQEAEDYLEEIKSRPGCAHGALWWIDRELHEAKAYVPESKGGYRKK